MNRRTLVLGLAATALVACSPPQRAAQQANSAPDPAAIIAPVYQPYIARGVMTGLQDQAPWSASLRATLVAMMARSETAGEPILDFDPIIGAQDYEIAALSLTTEAVVENSHATVRAHFTNLGRETEILYDMVWEADGWRVDNIRGEDWDLRQIAAQVP